MSRDEQHAEQNQRRQGGGQFDRDRPGQRRIHGLPRFCRSRIEPGRFREVLGHPVRVPHLGRGDRPVHVGLGVLLPRQHVRTRPPRPRKVPQP